MNSPDAKGLVFDIQRFSLHDGPGIRTTVFLKGCPLRCLWCDNPESQSGQVEVAHLEKLCACCGRCVTACSQEAIALRNGKPAIDRSVCNGCGSCVEACPNGALHVFGRWLTSEDVVQEVEKDSPFYENSGGGVTLSGGEPFAQGEFVGVLLRRLKEEGYHITVETSGYAPWQVVESCAPHIDLFYFDIKHLDSRSHKRLTGVPNELILANARRIAEMGKQMVLRVPFVPGLNTSDANLRSLGLFARDLGVSRIDILPYHRMGVGKYKALGRTYPAEAVVEPGDSLLQEAQVMVADISGIKVRIGG